jgi:HEAT repeat protein
MKAMLTNKKAWLALCLLGGLAGVAWWQHRNVLAWYHVRQLTFAYQENRAICAKRVADLDEAAVPCLLEGLHNSDALVCGNMQCALVLLAKRWTLADERAQRLVERVHDQFAEFSAPGQEKALVLLAGLLQHDAPRPLPPRLSKRIGAIVVEADKKPELRSATLLLAAELVDSVEPGQWVDVGRDMVERGLKEERAGVRVAALQLLLRKPMRVEKGLVDQAVPLLADPEPTVRKAALIALASESERVREENFLPLLHDDDAETQYLCEMALRKRGLSDDDIRLARMISDKNPAVRMRVVRSLRQMPDLNLAEWLRQLSHDPEPAVRAAAVRAAGDFPHIDLTQRLREMADGDPSETVQQNARFYLQQRLSRPAVN